jgi:hypothetical protein
MVVTVLDNISAAAILYRRIPPPGSGPSKHVRRPSVSKRVDEPPMCFTKLLSAVLTNAEIKYNIV